MLKNHMFLIGFGWYRAEHVEKPMFLIVFGDQGLSRQVLGQGGSKLDRTHSRALLGVFSRSAVALERFGGSAQGGTSTGAHNAIRVSQNWKNDKLSRLHEYK